MIAPADFDYVRQLVVRNSAIVLDPGKEYLVESRLLPVARKEGFASIQEMVRRMQSVPSNGLHTRVIEAMTTNETLFFRDIHPFETLRTAALPAILDRRSLERKLNILCAACSTGQEPYSLSMLLREHFPQLASWSVRIIGCDLSHDVLDRAKAGRYSQLEVGRGLPTSYLLKYFKRDGIEWEIDQSIRRMVEFVPANLAGPWPIFPVFDIIFMRNVLIYFDLETKKQIIAKARRQMRPDGFLILGAAETTFNIDESFERYEPGKAGWYRLRG